jgi:ABC-2 type transport system ATP-binding protein
VVGPNGAGKSTLFALILGFRHPTAGDVEIDGLEPAVWIRRNGASYLPERFTLPARWRAGEALLSLARLERTGEPAAHAARAIDRFGLENEVDARIGTLSRGTLQRIGLAQAFLARRELVVLDEPTEGLDPIWRLRLRDAIEELRAAGTTVLLASHDLTEVARMADRATVLGAGRVRDTLELRMPATKRAFLITLAEPSADFAELFPGAAAMGDDASSFRVEVDDAHELSSRLAALLARGGVLSSVAPAGPDLEERVRRVLDEPA